MVQDSFSEFKTQTKLDALSREELQNGYALLEKEVVRLGKEILRLQNAKLTDTQLQMAIEEQLSDLRNMYFGKSSERYKKSEKPKLPSTPPKPRSQKPSERYPNIPVVEKRIALPVNPDCGACGAEMQDSGMTENSEQLTVIPKKYEITLLKRVKYRCSKCHGGICTAALPPRIKEGSTYSDEMILDVALSKYCDLIPIERYAMMAARSGVKDIPPHALIETTHYLTEFLHGAYLGCKHEVFNSRVGLADETPHKMLEGSQTQNWQLWGFSSLTATYFECHDTRSGDVAGKLLSEAKTEVLVSDVFSGYQKAIREANVIRQQKNLPIIVNANCNAHARRYFFKSRTKYTKDAEFFLDHYHEIYQLEANARGKPPDEILNIRSSMLFHFKAMKAKAEEQLPSFPKDTKLAKAMSYFLENYAGLTYFIGTHDVPIDNNQQERLLRSHVVGRKTWYGTHSKQGAKTAAIMFTLVESCKLIQVNPREYFQSLVEDLHNGQLPYTPSEYKRRLNS